MKATYVWRTGPLTGREFVVSQVQRIEMGPEGPGRLAIPGVSAVAAVVALEQGRCQLTHLEAPGNVTITRKVSGEIKVLTVAKGEKVETKTHDVVTFAPNGLSVYCQYELEASDRFGFNLADLPEAVSPVSADRRKREVEAHSAARVDDLNVVKQRADTAHGVASAAQAEGRKSGRKAVVIGGGLAAAVAVLSLTGWLLLRGAEERLSERLGGVTRAMADAKNSYEENYRKLTGVRDDARQQLARMGEDYATLSRTLKAGDARLEDLRDQMDACRLELKQNQPYEMKFRAMQKDLDTALFLIECEMTFDRPIGEDAAGRPVRYTSMVGTGFVVNDRGHMITCKHVVQPWLFHSLWTGLMQGAGQGGAPVLKGSKLIAYPMGFRLPGAGIQTTDPYYSERNGKLKLLAVGESTLTDIDFGTPAAPCVRAIHLDFEHDVALLQIEAPGIRPIRLATDAEIAQIRKDKLLPVMVAGFPLGVGGLESMKVESSFTTGNVRKIEKFVQHSAPTCQGNSGGPLIDVEGRVIGIISWIQTDPGAQNFNGAVPATQANALLRRVR